MASDPIKMSGTAPGSDSGAVRRRLSPDAVLRSMDRCTKCGICQAYCPVAAKTARFPGPKYTGPQAQRFRVIEPTKDLSPELCSGCGICTSVCPNGVAITDMITIARARMVEAGHNLPMRQRLLNRPDTLGRVLGIVPAVANAILSNRTLRTVADATLGVHRDAPLPRVSGRQFRRWLSRQTRIDGPAITYFSGCAVEYYDPYVGVAAVQVLNQLGFHVDVPTERCCGLPMLSSGEWGAARRYANALIRDLASNAEAGATIVSTSTSCSLTLRSKYGAYLGMNTGGAQQVADSVVDLCEFLRGDSMDRLAGVLKPLSARVIYHGPCQLRGHTMGMPAVELLRLVPKLSVELSNADCCGVAGTYGYDSRKYAIATAVGKSLMDTIMHVRPDFVICDSETCRWHIEKSTGVPCRHPIEIIAASLGKADIDRGHSAFSTGSTT